MMTEAVEDLTTTLNEAASAAGVVGGMVDSITQAINQVRVLGVPVVRGFLGPGSLSSVSETLIIFLLTPSAPLS